MEQIRVSCPGSCGELFQCVADGRECLLSYNIDRRSWAAVEDCQKSGKFSFKNDKRKQALRLLTSSLKEVSLDYYSELPVGKGLSSSTADMVSCLQALSVYAGQPLTPEELTRLCAQIEPTDSVAFKEWTVLNPLSGDIVLQTDWQPNIYVYILEPEIIINTLGLARMTASADYPNAESAVMLDLFKEACLEKDSTKIGRLATYSSLLNNKRLPKPYLREIIRLSSDCGCLGVNVAHSGTVVGILIEKQATEKVIAVEKAIAGSPIADYYQKRSLCDIIYEGVIFHRRRNYQDERIGQDFGSNSADRQR